MEDKSPTPTLILLKWFHTLNFILLAPTVSSPSIEFFASPLLIKIGVAIGVGDSLEGSIGVPVRVEELLASIIEKKSIKEK